MIEFIGGLVMIVFALAFVAGVGHFLWIGAAALFRGLEGRTSGPPPRKSDTISSDDLTVTERQLRRLYQSKAITPRQWEELQVVFRRERARQQLDRVSSWTPVTPPDAVPPMPAKPVAAASEAIDIVDFADEPKPLPEPAVDIYRLRKRTPAESPLEPIFAPLATKDDELVADDVEIIDEPPRGTIAHLLQAFMEERNIRWGELVSGMLIVGSAVGLVISLWATLKESIPYFPALLFMLVTSAIHGAGLYTLRRWKLKSTSRGLLVIAALLVPLNFLAAMVLAEQSPGQAPRAVTDPLYLVAVVVGLLTYGAISYSSGRVLLRTKWWPMFLALMGPSVAQLYIVRLASPDISPVKLNLLAALPFAAFLLAMGTQLKQAAAGRRLGGRRLVQTQLLLGIGLFSVIMPVCLIVRKTHAIELTLAGLSPGLALVAAMILSTGLLIHRRVTQPELATTRTVGTALAMLGSSLMIATVVLAWPRPELLVAVGLLAFAVLTVLAVLGDLALLNIPAVAAFALASIVGMHWMSGTIAAGDGGTSGLELANVLLMGRSALALAALSLFAAGASQLPSLPGKGWGRGKPSNPPSDSHSQLTRADSYRYSAILLAAASILIAVRAGFFPGGIDGDWVTPIFALYAAVALAFGYRARSVAAAWVGSGLLLLTTIHALAWNSAVDAFLVARGWSVYLPGVVAVLAHASIVTLIAMFAALRNRTRLGSLENEDAIVVQRKVIEPLVASAVLTSGLVLPFVWFFNDGLISTHAAYAFWATTIWLCSAFLMRSPLLFFSGQILATVATGLTVTAVCVRQPWWHGNLAEPWHVQSQLASLAGLALIFVVARIVTRRSAVARGVMSSLPLPFDRLLLALVVVGIVALSALACAPGVAAEMTPVGARPALVEADTFALLGLGAIGCAALFVAAFAAFRGKGSTADVATAQGAGILSVLAFVLLASFWNPGQSAAIWSLLGISHIHAYGAGTWIALAVAVAALLVSLWERMRPAAVLLLVLAGSTVPILIAAAAEIDLQSAASPRDGFDLIRFVFALASNANLGSATILRFGLALYGLAIAGLLAFRTPLRAIANRIGVNRPDPLPPAVSAAVRQLALALTLLPVWALTARAVALMAGGRALAPNVLASWGDIALYGGPMWLLAAALLVHALRERSADFALASSLSVQAGVSVAMVVARWSTGLHLDVPALVGLLQANALCLAMGALVWLSLRRRIDPESLDQPSTAFGLQLRLAVAASATLVVWAAMGIIYSPAPLPLEIRPIGTWPSYAALMLTALAGLWSSKKSRRDAIAQGAVPVGIGLTTLLAGTSIQIPTLTARFADSWLAYHVLSGGWCLLLAGTVLTYFAQHRRSAANKGSSALVGWSIGLGSAVLALAVRGELADPLSPHWSAGLAAWVVLSTVALGLIARSQLAAFAATAIAMLAVALFWFPPLDRFPVEADVLLLEAILTAAALMGLFWLIVELYWQRRWSSAFDVHASGRGVHRFAGVATLVVGWALIAICMAAKTFALDLELDDYPNVSDIGGWLMMASIGMLLLATLWDRIARNALFALYLFAPMPAAIALDHLNLLPADLVFAIGCVLCAYVLLTSILWWQRRAVAALARSAGMSATTDENRTAEWLKPLSLSLTGVAMCITTWCVLTLPIPNQRLAAAAASSLLIPAMVLLGAGRQVDRFRSIALLLAAAVGVEFAWAQMAVDITPEGWLHRSIRLLVVLSGTTFFYTVLANWVVNEANRWYVVVRRAAAAVAGASVVALLLVLAQQGALYQPFVGAPVDNAEIIAVAVVLVGLAAALVSMAMLPGADPLELTDRGRMFYVYAAEAVIALLFLHLRLTKPELFGHYLRPYWPVVVIAIAFLGIGAGELFRRKNWIVLAEPLERTGAFLPLLPALGFWAISSEMSYSSDLFLIGLLYVVASMWRKSFVYGLAAALAGNGALWALFQEHGLPVLTHPQMWFIPPALSVLAAAQINRRNLSEAQLTSLRYLCITVIYVSSTGEMFIAGVADSIWLPMVLAALSVAGVFAGILMRVRAFLYLGSSFLMLSIVSMVWHAAQRLDHVWPWWAFGIALGLSILTLFGLFEKKRNDALLLLDRVRQWEP